MKVILLPAQASSNWVEVEKVGEVEVEKVGEVVKGTRGTGAVIKREVAEQSGGWLCERPWAYSES